MAGPAGAIGDDEPHLFVFFTADTYQTAYCYAPECGAFVQYDEAVVPGISLTPSSINGTQRVATLEWYRDTSNGNWWLRWGGDTWVG